MFWTVALEKTLESPLGCKEIKPVNRKGNHWKDWCWNWGSTPLATWCEEPPHWKIPWCWERLKAEGEGDDRGWNGWMASPTPWTWVWASSGSWWCTGKPGLVKYMGSQSVGCDQAIKRSSDWTELNHNAYSENIMFTCWIFKFLWALHST